MPKVPKTTSLYNIFAASLEALAHHQNVGSLSLFFRYYFGRCSSELAQLLPLPFSRGRSNHCFCHHSYMFQGYLRQQFLSLYS